MKFPVARSTLGGLGVSPICFCFDSLMRSLLVLVSALSDINVMKWCTSIQANCVQNHCDAEANTFQYAFILYVMQIEINNGMAVVAQLLWKDCWNTLCASIPQL